MYQCIAHVVHMILIGLSNEINIVYINEGVCLINYIFVYICILNVLGKSSNMYCTFTLPHMYSVICVIHMYIHVHVHVFCECTLYIFDECRIEYLTI